MTDPVRAIIAKHPKEWEEFCEGLDITCGTSPLFTELYEHFVNSNEMPYGIAKAREGDPDVWISERLRSYQ